MRWGRRLDPEVLNFTSQKASRFTLWQPTQTLLVADSQFAEEAARILNSSRYASPMCAYHCMCALPRKKDSLWSNQVFCMFWLFLELSEMFPPQ